MSCGECRGQITVQHPDDEPILAFRELMEKLAEEIGSRKEARNVANQLVQDVYHGSPENLDFIEALEEEGGNQ
ncbi:hypothetical protein [Haloplanus natans]|uniref:hypothetical protein n=1 Tax=Haloplanus natans TaxID=376171 RepID=UPI00067763BA|nr:hypothetical protein [Haloplanus natans]